MMRWLMPLAHGLLLTAIELTVQYRPWGTETMQQLSRYCRLIHANCKASTSTAIAVAP
jgi:hypothetical protein